VGRSPQVQRSQRPDRGLPATLGAEAAEAGVLVRLDRRVQQRLAYALGEFAWSDIHRISLSIHLPD
jgi:hypothetical protein